MDMETDIADILASVSRPTIPQRTTDLQALTRAWVNERTAPELLPYPGGLVDRVMERVKIQIETIEELTGTLDPGSNFKLVILQTELERFKFLVRSLMRARMAKIDAHPQHHLHRLLKHQEASADPSQHLDPTPANLSTLETQYLRAHTSLLHSHYSTAFLSTFPNNLQRMDDSAGGTSMVDKPDTESTVFVRVLRDCGSVVVQGEGADDGGGKFAELRRGDVWVLRWGDVRTRVWEGDVECV